LNLHNNKIHKIVKLTIIEWGKYFKIDPEIYPLLALLKKSKKLALITNYDHYPYIKELLKSLELIDYFETITISSEIGKKKPDPEIFLPAIEKSGLKPGEIVYVGDSDVDIIGAKAARMVPILIQRKYEYPVQDFKSEYSIINKQPDSHFKGIREIKKISDLKNILF
jgi:putative hydrolase of the HAD superfamily